MAIYYNRAITTSTNITISTNTNNTWYFPLATPSTPPSTPEGLAMPNRDAHGRFAPAPTDKTPVADVGDAAAQFQQFTQIMNRIADSDGLCSTFDGVVTRMLGGLPSIERDIPNQPDWYTDFSISGQVYLPVADNSMGGGRNESRALHDRLIAEFNEWATAHDLDQTKAGTWLAWLDSLPDERKHIATYGGNERNTGSYAYRRTGSNARTPLRFRTEAVASQAPQARTDAVTVVEGVVTGRPAVVGDRVRLRRFIGGDAEVGDLGTVVERHPDWVGDLYVHFDGRHSGARGGGVHHISRAEDLDILVEAPVEAPAATPTETPAVPATEEAKPPQDEDHGTYVLSL